MEAAGVVDGGCLVNFDEGCLVLAVVGVAADQLLASLVPVF